MTYIESQQAIASRIACLRPDTVLALDNVTFEAKALALPGVTAVTNNIADNVTGTGALADTELHLAACMRLTPDSAEHTIVTDSHVILGGLAYDCDCESPVNNDEGSGEIVHYGLRRGNSEQSAKFYAALGLDTYGGKNLEADAVAERVRDSLVEMRKHRALMSSLSARLRDQGLSGKWDDVITWVQRLCDSNGPSYLLDAVANNAYQAYYFTRLSTDMQDLLEPLADLVAEPALEKAWEAAKDAGEIGNPLAIPLDIYEHSGISYSLQGEGMQCRWDTSSFGALWLPTTEATNNIRSQALNKLGLGSICYKGAFGSESDPLYVEVIQPGIDHPLKFIDWASAVSHLMAINKDHPELQATLRATARDYARGIIQAYSSWANGDNHGILVYVVDRTTGEVIEDHSEEVWGFIGSEDAESELLATMLNRASSLMCPH